MRSDRKNLIDEESEWKVYKIPKKDGGFRIIEDPSPKLREHLINVYKKLDEAYNLKVRIKNPFSHGFIKGRNIVTNALVHVGKKYVAKIDIKDFFGSISCEKFHERYPELFTVEIPPYGTGWEELFKITEKKHNGRICTTTYLPQGSPVSPYIANIYLSKFDWTAATIAGKYGVHYTRYADNITLSGNDREKVRRVGKRLMRILENKYRLETHKMHIIPQWRRQKICGVVVNAKPQADRKYRRKVRALLYKIQKGEITDPEEIRKIMGMKSFVDMIKNEKRTAADNIAWLQVRKLLQVFTKEEE